MAAVLGHDWWSSLKSLLMVWTVESVASTRSRINFEFAASLEVSNWGRSSIFLWGKTEPGVVKRRVVTILPRLISTSIVYVSGSDTA